MRAIRGNPRRLSVENSYKSHHYGFIIIYYYLLYYVHTIVPAGGTNYAAGEPIYFGAGRPNFYASGGSHFFSRVRTKNVPAAGSHCWVRAGPTFLQKSRSGEKPFFDIGRAQFFKICGAVDHFFLPRTGQILKKSGAGKAFFWYQGTRVYDKFPQRAKRFFR